ncbi:LCP family protein [Curtobacterium sp. Leaf261]|uniref:LCP family protein n=1 Tax=Curtobacterium sp. Leaf261 TaxID=1736311 RepID=UPI0006F46237|nr:LCP family protein [Curtobacterium sp. Leaf261]KQO61369.1 hypothetical protein ASF23_12895 [Curtobacterium sp. Leaf261]
MSIVSSLFVGNLVSAYDSRSTKVHHAIPTTNRPAPLDSTAMNILLIGSDSRARLSPDGDHPAGSRADALMLVHLDADRKAVFVMSIMRDSWVDIPGYGMAKINAAYSLGGIPLTVQTVERLVDVPIDHVAEIDFQGFRDMTNALGGVTVDSTYGFDARGHRIVPGANELDGDAALAFVRERYAFPDADHQRVRNQQAFIRGLVAGVISRGTLTNPGRIADFVTATSSSLTIDSGLTFRTLADIGWSLRHLTADDLTTFTMPVAGGGTSADGQSYVSVDEGAQDSLRAALRSDGLGAWLAARS